MDYNNVEEKMQKVLNYLEDELDGIRAGRANPAVLNKIHVDYYGASTAINQLGTIAVPEARQILITPWDKTCLSAIEKGIQKADLGVNPMNDGNSIRLNFPELNEERRKEISKEVRALGEESKVAIRNTRREFIDVAKAELKKSEITEDELKTIEEKIQKITDKYVKEIDKIILSKEQEIMEV